MRTKTQGFEQFKAACRKIRRFVQFFQMQCRLSEIVKTDSFKKNVVRHSRIPERLFKYRQRSLKFPDFKQGQRKIVLCPSYQNGAVCLANHLHASFGDFDRLFIFAVTVKKKCVTDQRDPEISPVADLLPNADAFLKIRPAQLGVLSLAGCLSEKEPRRHQHLRAGDRTRSIVLFESLFCKRLGFADESVIEPKACK